MKSIDVTLFFQIINFLTVFWFLRKYIFIPSSKILEDQEFQDLELKQLIKELLTKKDDATEKMNLRLSEMKNQLKALIPIKKQESLYINKDLQNEAENFNLLLSQDERQKIKKMISDSLAEVKL